MSKLNLMSHSFQAGKQSDTGSRYSFITHKRGNIPNTIWQRGAMFSSQISRASRSAGKYVPNYVKDFRDNE